MKGQMYGVPREGDNFKLSEDKIAYREENSRFRYALADGVSVSFLPGKWAQILTDAFVARESDFIDQKDFEQWQRQCSQAWHTWTREIWVQQAMQKNQQYNWEREITRGASATFVGCSFSQAEPLYKDTTQVQVTSVGDAEFFLISPSADTTLSGQRWAHQAYFLTHQQQFGLATETL